MKILNKIIKWFVGLFRRPQYKFKVVQDIPEQIVSKNTIYLVGENENYWCVILQCPCGCQDSIHLNLIDKIRPRWKVDLTNKKGVTLSPSINKKKGCKSHFFIREGDVVWA